MDDELRSQMNKSHVESALIGKMPAPAVEWNGNVCTARVGYKKGNYDANTPSDGYKVVFLNYGTPHRPERYGRVAKRGFIERAKKKAKPQIKRQQEQTLNDVLKGLKQ